MAANWNNALQLASGEYVLVLHDDDFLLNNSLTKIIDNIKKYKDKHAVMLCGVRVVDAREQLLKKQTFSRELYLTPKQALLQLMSNSSFVRFPGIFIRRDVFKRSWFILIPASAVWQI